MEHQLPKYVLTADEAEQIIQQSIQDPEGLRDSAVLEARRHSRAWCAVI
jgi:hypothetical protein